MKFAYDENLYGDTDVQPLDDYDNTITKDLKLAEARLAIPGAESLHTWGHEWPGTVSLADVG